MASTAIKIDFRGQSHKWTSQTDKLSALVAFVAKTCRINGNLFELEYIDDIEDDESRTILADDDDLLDALEFARDEGLDELIIYVKSDATVADPSQKKIDFKIYDDDTTNCGTDYICKCTERLVNAMKYYQTLDMHNTDDGKELMDFYANKYAHILHDFSHLVTKHPNQLDKMYDFAVGDMGLDVCTMRNCAMQRRHNRDKDEDNMGSMPKHMGQNKDDIHKFVYVRDLMDGVHCYILHQYDFGFAIYNKQAKIDKAEKQHDQKIKFKDSAFAEISRIIKEAKKKTKEFARFSKKNNKYDIERTKKEHDDIQFMDTIVDKTCGKNAKLKNRFRIFLSSEEYDTDAVYEDHETIQPKLSNLYQELKVDAYNDLTSYFRELTIDGLTFKTGLIYYYWDWYEKKHEEDEDFRNVNYHSGYRKHELFHKPKHANLKDEILSQITDDLWKISMVKVEECMKLEQTKRLKAADMNAKLHFDINVGDPITKEHVLSVVLYTDNSELCTTFSSTFFKKKKYYSLKKTKARNIAFGLWSRLLRETIEYFGCNGDVTEEEEKENEGINKLKGPFFCGMSTEMPIGSFNIRLCGPTSTSRSPEVSIRFSGDQGMILQFNNNGDYTSKQLRAFDCSWLSNYNAEAEYLFVGGYIRMRLETVIFQRTNQNFRECIEPLFYLDCMLNGTWMDKQFNEDKLTDSYKQFLNHVMTKPQNLIKDEYPVYVYRVFESFCYQKTQIVLNLDELNGNFNKYKDLIMDSERKNLFKDTLFNLFNNLERIVIYTTCPDGIKIYSFKWKHLLELVRSPSMPSHFKITIFGRSKYDRYVNTPKSETKCWISDQWKDSWEDEFGETGAYCDLITKTIDKEQLRVKLELMW